MLDCPEPDRRAENSDIGIAVAIVIPADRNVPGGSKISSAQILKSPESGGGAENRDVGPAVSGIVAGVDQIVGRAGSRNRCGTGIVPPDPADEGVNRSFQAGLVGVFNWKIGRAGIAGQLKSIEIIEKISAQGFLTASPQIGGEDQGRTGRCEEADESVDGAPLHTPPGRD